MATKTKKDYTFAVGRRKRSVARVRLYSGRGETTINGMTPSQYFPSSAEATLWNLPFELTKTAGKYFASVKVRGGGKVSQLKAGMHGVSRALNAVDTANLHQVLKDNGLLTRDARKKERRKIGTGGKARRQKSSPKR